MSAMIMMMTGVRGGGVTMTEDKDDIVISGSHLIAPVLTASSSPGAIPNRLLGFDLSCNTPCPDNTPPPLPNNDNGSHILFTG